MVVAVSYNALWGVVCRFVGLVPLGALLRLVGLFIAFVCVCACVGLSVCVMLLCVGIVLSLLA